MGRISGLWRSVLWIKGSLILAGIGGLVAYENHDLLRQLDYNLFDRRQDVAEGSFQDPPGLSAEWHSNERGELESVLVYRDNRDVVKTIPVLQDMLPPSDMMIEGLNARGDSVYMKDQIPKQYSFDFGVYADSLSDNDKEWLVKSFSEVFHEMGRDQGIQSILDYK